MPEIGQTISHYRIIEKLGQGGMGEVFLAHDTSLDRKVALKFLPDVFSGDPERLARFEREAKLLASLNHPHIATIYGLEQADGKRFLAMELVEGETLAQQIARGPVPVEETLEICRQIAEGLEAAHEKGIIHRDLKPANIKITPGGKVKILDFGLAKAFQEDAAAADLSHSPTITEAMTRVGVILGTAAYMSPEQAKGRFVDKRTDIWAFGCVLFECLTGKQPFQGETVTETLAAVIKGEPGLSMLPPETPYFVRSILRRCLQKDAGLRLRDIGDARIEIQDATLRAQEIQQAVTPAPGRWRAIALILAAGIVLIAATLALQVWRQAEKAQVPSRSFVLPLPVPITDSWQPILAISPDGSQIAYSGGAPKSHLYLRRQHELDFKPIDGTERGYDPFFSPDGEWIGFFADRKLKKVPVSGGQVIELTDPGVVPSGGFWETGESILFQLGWKHEIARANASAPGKPLEKPFTPDRKNNEIGLLWPQPLANTNLVLMTAYTGNITWMNDARIVIGPPDDPSKRVTVTGGTYGRYLSTGHLIYCFNGRLMAAPFDLKKLSIEEGSVKEVLTGVWMNPSTGCAHLAISETGDLVYVPGSRIIERDDFVLVDRNGTQQPVNLPNVENESRLMTSPNVSPDGLRIAVHMSTANDDIYVYEFSNGSLTRASSEDGDQRSPVWSHDGTQLAYTSEPGPIFQMLLKNISGGSASEPLFRSEFMRYPRSFRPDEKTLAFVENNPKTKGDIWIGTLKGEAKPFLNTVHSEYYPAFSSDGKWLAYQSDKTGQMKVYITDYPDKRDEKLISPDGGTEPHWGPKDNELFYLNGDSLWSVEISFAPTLRAAKPKSLFKIGPTFLRYESEDGNSYAMLPDGQHFVFIKRTQMNPATQCIFIQNWFEELKRLVPTGKK